MLEVQLKISEHLHGKVADLHDLKAVVIMAIVTVGSTMTAALLLLTCELPLLL